MHKSQAQTGSEFSIAQQKDKEISEILSKGDAWKWSTQGFLLSCLLSLVCLA